MDVDLTVTADEDAQFVAIEDPLPAGLAYQPRQHESGDGWSGLQFFDDRVVFFATRLSRRLAAAPALPPARDDGGHVHGAAADRVRDVRAAGDRGRPGRPASRFASM